MVGLNIKVVSPQRDVMIARRRTTILRSVIGDKHQHRARIFGRYLLCDAARLIAQHILRGRQQARPLDLRIHQLWLLRKEPTFGRVCKQFGPHDVARSQDQQIFAWIVAIGRKHRHRKRRHAPPLQRPKHHPQIQHMRIKVKLRLRSAVQQKSMRQRSRAPAPPLLRSRQPLGLKA